MLYLAPLALALLAQADAPDQGPPKPAVAAADLVAALESAVAEAIARAEPSVVAISRFKSTNGGGDETTAVRGRPQPELPEPAPAFPGGRLGGLDPNEDDFQAMPGDFGSGVVIGAGGEILTCYHVIRGAERIHVRAPGRQSFYAEVLAADPRSDLAVIAPRAAPGQGPRLKPIPLGASEALRKGSFLVVLGNPYNAARDGRASAGWGILANTARRIAAAPEERRQTMLFRYQPSLLQLDAKLNLGLSGGAVINLKGELVGITTTGGNPAAFDAQAGYAIPMDPLGRRIVAAMRQGKEAEYGFLGVTIEKGNQINTIQGGTPAEAARLLTHDTVLAVDGRPVEEEGLSLALSTVAPGQTVKVRVRHQNGRVEDKDVTMAKYPTKGPVPAIVTNRPPAWRGVRVDFTSVLISALWDGASTRSYPRGGVGVVEIESGSPADQAGLKKGQVITEVDGSPVRNPTEFAAAVADKQGPVTLTTELGDEPDKKITVK